MRIVNYSQNLDFGKNFILTTPTKMSDIDLDEYVDDTNYRWIEKSRRLQARRWRKIKHQLS